MRPAQAAIEYLFMIALALIMVYVAVRLMRQTTEQATQQINKTSEELIQILRNMSSNG